MDSQIILPPVKPSVIGLSTSGPFQLLVGGDLGPMGGQVQRDRISTRSFLLRAKLLLVLVCLGTVVSPAWALFSVCPKCNWRGDAPLGAACPNCGYGGNTSNSGGSTPYNGPNLWEALRERKERKAEEARQKILQAAWDANHQGIEYLNKGDLSSAIASYQASLAKNPDDPVVRKNLAHAQSRLANDRGLAAYNHGDWASAVAFFQESLNRNPYPENNGVIQNNLTASQSQLQAEQAKLQDKAAATAMQQSIKNFAQSLNAKPVPAKTAAGNGGGLDFLPASPPSGATPAAATLEFGDPMVVDARTATAGPPKELIRDAVADTPKDQATAAPLSAAELGNLEGDLRKRLAETTDPQTQAWLEAQLAWTLQQKGDSKGAVAAIEKASALDPGSSLLKLLGTSAFAETREQLADAVFAAQEYLKTHPGNRVAAGMLAEAKGKLRQAIDAATPGRVAAAPPASPGGPNPLPLVPFAQQARPATGGLPGLDEAAKAKAEKDFVFQDFGKQSHAPHWQESPPLDKRIQDSLARDPAKYPELKQNLAKREALVAGLKTADPGKAEEIKKQVELVDRETEKKSQEILKTDFPAAPDL